MQQQSGHGGPPPPHKPHAQQISLEKLNERGYHLEKQQQQPVQQQPTHIAENMYRMPMSLSSGMLTISPQNQQVTVLFNSISSSFISIFFSNFSIQLYFISSFQQMQNMKPSGSITQGYMTTNNTM